jgi:hypothetical protein
LFIPFNSMISFVISIPLRPGNALHRNSAVVSSRQDSASPMASSRSSRTPIDLHDDPVLCFGVDSLTK